MQHAVVDGKKVAVILDSIVGLNLATFKITLVCYSLDQRLDARGFRSYVERTWRAKSPFKNFARPGGFLLVEFSTESACKYALENHGFEHYKGGNG